ncbi:Hint domain-containing protein [Puia sp. P3]|uniref:Hint domain-containing protein n=1 Tax=Puia sp. P3 TaxID=3423952 RepID=UPI003D66413C
MRKFLFSFWLLAAGLISARAQDSVSRALTMAEYNKAKTFSVADLDKDTYIKFENAYILDKGGFGKPYFITGDDGMKKRVDLYRLILKEGRVDLGTVIYYTTETGKRYTAVMPGYKADGKVWEKYFEDIHGIDNEEKFYVLKLSYVLSKELGFQFYRSATGGTGKEISRESGTYGNDICFPGDMKVEMAGGGSKPVSEIKSGDKVIAVDPSTHLATTVTVKDLTVHAAKNYVITNLLLLSASGSGRDLTLVTKSLQATPNHPMVTAEGERKAGDLKEGDRVLCRDEKSGICQEFTVWSKREAAGGAQPVYNIVAGAGNTFIMNGVMVLQKPLKN